MAPSLTIVVGATVAALVAMGAAAPVSVTPVLGWPGNVATWPAPPAPNGAAVTARSPATAPAAKAKRDIDEYSGVGVSGNVAVVAFNYASQTALFYSLASWPPTLNMTISEAYGGSYATPIALAGSAYFASYISGSIVLYECDFVTWSGCTQQYSIPSCATTYCAMSVSEDGTLLAVTDAQYSSSSVVVYACEFVNWTCTAQTTLAAAAVQGDIVVVGEGNGVEVFTCNRQASPWSCRAFARMLGSNGYSVAISDSLVLSTSFEALNQVFAYQCDYYAETCALVATLSAPAGTAGNFGTAVDVTGTSITVGDFGTPGIAWNFNCTPSVELAGPWSCQLLGSYSANGFGDGDQVGAAAALQSGAAVVVMASLTADTFVQLPPTDACTLVVAYATPAVLPFTLGGEEADAAVASGRTCMIQSDAYAFTAGWLANSTGTTMCCRTRGHVVTAADAVCYAGCGGGQVYVDQFLKNPQAGSDECFVDCYTALQNTCSPYPVGLGASVAASLLAPAAASASATTTVHRDGFLVMRDVNGDVTGADGAYAVNVGTDELPTYVYCLNKGSLSAGATVCSNLNNACLQSASVFVSFSSNDGETCFFHCYSQA